MIDNHRSTDRNDDVSSWLRCPSESEEPHREKSRNLQKWWTQIRELLIAEHHAQLKRLDRFANTILIDGCPSGTFWSETINTFEEMAHAWEDYQLRKVCEKQTDQLKIENEKLKAKIAELREKVGEDGR